MVFTCCRARPKARDKPTGPPPTMRTGTSFMPLQLRARTGKSARVDNGGERQKRAAGGRDKTRINYTAVALRWRRRVEIRACVLLLAPHPSVANLPQRSPP